MRDVCCVLGLGLRLSSRSQVSTLHRQRALGLCYSRSLLGVMNGEQPGITVIALGTVEELRAVAVPAGEPLTSLFLFYVYRK